MPRRNKETPRVPYVPEISGGIVRRYNAPQFIPGVQHRVEGQNATRTIWVNKRDATRASRADRYHEEYNHANAAAASASFASKTRYEDAVAGYKRKAKLRLAIPSLPDSDAVNTEVQKQSSIKRKRGRVGTMLSQKETLG